MRAPPLGWGGGQRQIAAAAVYTPKATPTPDFSLFSTHKPHFPPKKIQNLIPSLRKEEGGRWRLQFK